jgi:hypothetical protein
MSRRIDTFLEAPYIDVPFWKSHWWPPLRITYASCQSSTLLISIACMVATGHIAGLLNGHFFYQYWLESAEFFHFANIYPRVVTQDVDGWLNNVGRAVHKIEGWDRTSRQTAPGTYWKEGLVGPRCGLDDMKKWKVGARNPTPLPPSP